MSRYNENETVMYNDGELLVTNLVPSKLQKTRKSTIGKSLVEADIIGMNAQQWRLNVSGIIYASIGTARARIEALDDASAHAYTDGIHDGNFAIEPGSLVFTDSATDAGMMYRYKMVLLEW